MNGKTGTTTHNDIGVELRKEGESSSSHTKKPHIRFDEREYHVNFCERLHYSDPSRAKEGLYRGGGRGPEPIEGCCCVVS